MRRLFRLKTVERSVWLALIGTAGSLPYVYHSYFNRFASYVEDRTSEVDFSWMLSVITGLDMPVYQLMVKDVVLIFLACLLCCMCGVAWARSRGLPGLGSVRDFRGNILFIGGWALVFDLVLFLVMDRPLSVRMPHLYPSTAAGVMVFMLMAACFEEIVFRYGFLTLLYRLWPNRHAAVFLSSLLYALAVYKTFTFLKLDCGLNYLTALAFGTRFLSGLILGYIYVLRGLYPVMLFKLLVCARLFFLI